jgi:hypothetical protein
VVAAALALLDGDRTVDVALLPAPPDEGAYQDAGAYKVEGLALCEAGDRGARVIAVVDADDPGAASVRLDLRLRW